MKLIVGLGNIGSQYTYTRHNIGFLVCDKLASSANSSFKRSIIAHGQEAKILLGQESVMLFKPSTFMNNSGIAIRDYMVKKEIGLQEVFIIVDDVALAFGQLRVRNNGADGGHNGLKSISSILATQQYARLRIGVGAPPVGLDLADYVLSDFTPGEQQSLPEIIDNACLCVSCWATQGIEVTMNQFNGSKQ